MSVSEDLLTQPSPDLSALRVFAMLPPHSESRAHYLVQLLMQAKRRWHWHIDVLCRQEDKEAFKELVSPSGKLLVAPDAFQSAPWESKSDLVAEVDQRLRQAELATMVPAGQLILASQATIGCAFVGPVQNLPLTRAVAQVLRDNTEPSRILRRWFQFADETIATIAPDLVIAYEWEKPWRSTIWMAAASRTIPCVAIRRSKLNADHYYWTTDRTLFNGFAAELAVAKRHSNAAVSDHAITYIRKFREKPETVKYVQEKWYSEMQKRWLAWHLRLIRNAARQLAIRGNETRGQLLYKLVFYNSRHLRLRRQGRYFQTLEVEQLRSMRYIYFPMHKETDLPLVFQAPRWHDQRNTVQLLAAVLPSGYRLLVREHRFNLGRRPSRYYRDLTQLPNVVLIDALESQFKYIQNADLIVTENGTSGWEGLLLGRRVLALSRTSYDSAGLANKIDDPDRIGAYIISMLAKPPVPDAAFHDKQLGWMIDAERAATFSMKEVGIPAGLEQLSILLKGKLRQSPRKINVMMDARIAE